MYKPLCIVFYCIDVVIVFFKKEKKSDDNNLQNMPFDRFIYWNGTVELTLQVTGTPFQQGLAIFYVVAVCLLQPSSSVNPGCPGLDSDS